MKTLITTIAIGLTVGMIAAAVPQTGEKKTKDTGTGGGGSSKPPKEVHDGDRGSGRMGQKGY